MITFLVTTAIVMLALGLVAYLSSMRSSHESDQASALSFLPGDIKYEFRRKFPLLLSNHHLDRDQHHPNSGSPFFAVTANAATAAWRISEEYDRCLIFTTF